MVKVVEQQTSKHKVVGSSPATFLNFFFVFHSHIHNIYCSIYKVFPSVVEACLQHSLFQYNSVQRDSHGAVPSQDLNPCPCEAQLQRLNCVWCTVELKLVGNLEWRIKFYREKKPRHFFYTIEYPYPPTNSAQSAVATLTERQQQQQHHQHKQQQQQQKQRRKNQQRHQQQQVIVGGGSQEQ